ncbi:MAG: DsrE family protein [Gemmatimonadaceae bacterium]|nr:DsrE family protein [Gemmatimonadaceae bacterium]MCW5826039.1 DsrE family protein [Gemmatimonadaceae bacterium]
MRLFVRLAFAAIVVASPIALAAQTGEALIRQIGGTPAVTDPDFRAPADLTYRRAWHVTVGPEAAGGIAPGFRWPAQFLRLIESNGVPRSNIKLAIIVHGTATQSLLNNATYRARTGADNGSIALLTALHEAGVQIIVCGEALISRDVPRGQLLPFVKVATTATSANAILSAQGYQVIPPAP